MNVTDIQIVISLIKKHLPSAITNISPLSLYEKLAEGAVLTEAEKQAVRISLGLSASGIEYYTARQNISSQMVLAQVADGGVVYASNDNLDQRLTIVGVSTSSAPDGGNVFVKTEGILTDPTWGLDINSPIKPLFLGRNGNITSQVPNRVNGDLFSMIIGVPLSATTMRVSIQPPIQLG